VFSEAPSTTTAGGGKRRRRSRGQRGKLRRHLAIEHVRVEGPFVLNRPHPAGEGGDSANIDGAADTSTTTDSDDGAGEGCYVTATVNNRRYYGVLIDQNALKAASLLHFQNQARGLDLNRRMKVLGGSQRGEGTDTDADTNGQSEDPRKRPASRSPILKGHSNRPRANVVPPDTVQSSSTAVTVSSTPPARQVQKFRYEDHGIHGGFRVLLATYADVDAASEDDLSERKRIEAACRAGGDYVGKYYYQYEVQCSIPTRRVVGCYCRMRSSLTFVCAVFLSRGRRRGLRFRFRVASERGIPAS